MKIWLINHYATPPDYGSSTRHYVLAKELRKHGHEVTIIASQFHHLTNSEPSNQASKFKTWQDDYVKFLLLPTPKYSDNGLGRLWNMLFFAYKALRLPKHYAERPDIIIGSSVHPFAAWAAERLAADFQVPFCFEVRDLWPQTLIDMQAIGKRHPLTILLHQLERYLYQKAQRIITLLPFAYEYICALGIPKEKIEYIPNGIDLNLFPESQPVTLEDKERFTVMYLGAHGPANHLETVVEAAAEMSQNPATRSVHWRLIGQGPDKERLKHKVKQLNLNNIVLEDSIPKNAVPKVATQADAFIFHLRGVDVFKFGISPNKLFDYLACQRPIVFACAARNNPVEEAGAGITVPPEDPQAMAAAVRQLSKMTPEERGRMGQRGRKYVEENHSYQYLGERLNHLLENLTCN